MGPNESRLRAMINPDSLATWGLNEEDRKAIQWAFDRIASLERELTEARQWYHDGMKSLDATRTYVRSAMVDLELSLKANPSPR